MARIPDPAEQQRLQVRPSSNVAQQGAVGAEGAAMSQLGDTVFKLAEQEMKSINEAKAREAETALRMKELALADEASQVKLGNVSNSEEPFVDTRMARYDAAATEIESALSGAQKEIFKARTAPMRLDHNSRLMRHAVVETEKYKDQQFEGNVTSLAVAASTRWTDPKELKASLEGIRAEYDSRLAEGYPKAKVEADKAKAISATHLQVIENMQSSGNVLLAKDYFAQHQNEILDQGIATKLVQDASVQTGIDAGRAAFAEIGADATKEVPPGELNAKILSLLPKDADPNTVQHARAEAEMLRVARVKDLEIKRAAPLSMVIAGRTEASIRGSAEFRALDPNGQLYILNQIRTRDSGGSEAQSFTQLRAMDKLVNSPEFLKMDNNQVYLFAQTRGIPAASAQRLIEIRNGMLNPADVKGAVDEDLIKGSYLAHNIAEDTKDQKKYLQVKNYIDTNVARLQRTLQRPLTRDEQQREVDRAMSKVKQLNPGWFFDSEEEVPRALAEKGRVIYTPQEINAAAPTAAFRERVTMSAKNKGTAPPSETEIRRAWLMYNDF